MVKKWLSLLLSIIFIGGILVCAVPAHAADGVLPLDGTLVKSQTTEEKHYETYSFSLSKRGILTFKIKADSNMLLVTLKNESSNQAKSIVTFSSDDFAREDTVVKKATLFLDKGEYSIEVYGLKSAFSMRANFKAYLTADGSSTLSVDKKETYFDSEWKTSRSHKIIVKQAYRLVFTIKHTMPLQCNVKSAKNAVVLKNTKLNSGTYGNTVADTLVVNLHKGTYYLNVATLPGLDNPCDRGGIYNIKMQAKDYIKAPTGLKTVTRQTTKQTISYKGLKGVDGYQVQCSDGGKNWAQTKTGKSLSCSFSGLVPGKTYKFRVRSYVVENGKKYFSDWSKTYSSCTKPEKTTLKKVTSKKAGQVTTNWNKVKGSCTGYEIIYSYDRSFKTVEKRMQLKASDNALQAFTIGKLKSYRYCYVKVRAYTRVNSVLYYGAWSLYAYTLVK
ncbi:MAG: fibronectin type III domain-containing protein [Clostridia bacterium]|nr:fibronectin type III domain-containing protein [Clostridia bacterium]